MNHRILFLCGSLVPGKDGVGDYTRKLAAQLMAAGTGVRLVATHDKGTPTVVEEEQPEGPYNVAVLRIPYHSSGRNREDLLQEVLDGFDPGQVSLQYVPYSFSPYGLPFPFIRQLGRLRHQGRWHIMFHELWITHRGLLTPKAAAVSALQRLAVVALARTLSPAVVHTHIPSYQSRLRRLGLEARPLPLFANIEAVAAEKADIRGPEAVFRLGFFSQFLPERVIPFIQSLDAWLKATGGPRLEIRLLGGGPDKVAATRQTLAGHFPDVELVAPGFLPAEALSRELRMLDLGITPVDHHLMGKSGTVSAFLSHGIAVAAPYRTERAPSFFTPGLSAAVLEKFTPEGLSSARRAVRHLDTRTISPEGVARQLAMDLALTSPPEAYLSSNRSSESAHPRR